MARVLGISCSLRNARFGTGNDALVSDLRNCATKEQLRKYIDEQAKIRAEDFFDAGRKDELPFDQLYRNLKKAKGDRGLSNSEAALAAALWGAHEAGAEINHLGLSQFFPMQGSGANLDQLRESILAADALLISGPVYFGDRGSPAQELFEFLRADKAVAAHIRNRVYAGIAVGAKRNGGQETTLIYQIVDATNLSMLAVGNDSSTTSQYGGTAHAGDVGTLSKDEYGIETSIGTGKRLANIANMIEVGRHRSVKDKVRISVWLLQDMPDHRGREYVKDLCAQIEEQCPEVAFQVHDFTEETIFRCIGCDICPTDVGPPEDYRCIIKSGNDLFSLHHKEIIDTDAVLIAAYSPIERDKTHSVYQRFIERTRYIRRDDYLLGDRLVAPLVISELDSNQNLHIRMLTSMVRHHLVLHHPVIAMESDGKILNWDSALANGVSFAQQAIKLTAGRLATAPDKDATLYNPVGYVISAEKSREDRQQGRTTESVEHRRTGHTARKLDRLTEGSR